MGIFSDNRIYGMLFLNGTILVWKCEYDTPMSPEQLAYALTWSSPDYTAMVCKSYSTTYETTASYRHWEFIKTNALSASSGDQPSSSSSDEHPEQDTHQIQ